MAKNKISTHKPKKKKVPGFKSSQIKSARLCGYPNKDKCEALRKIQQDYTDGVNAYIKALDGDVSMLPLILMRQQRSPEMRAFEKAHRTGKLNAVLSQSAFDYAVDRLATRLEDIKAEVHGAS